MPNDSYKTQYKHLYSICLGSLFSITLVPKPSQTSRSSWLQGIHESFNAMVDWLVG